MKTIIANFKMNPVTAREAAKLASACDKKGVVIAPPPIFIEATGRKLKRAALAAQDVSREGVSSGPFTGEISAAMLKEVGVKYVIVGHSERRALGETDAVVNKKLKAVSSAGLKAVLCVGEPERESGIWNKELWKAKRYVKNQLKKDLVGIQDSRFKIHNSLIIAYEPVWAIGSGRSDTPENASKMARFIEEFIVKSYKFKVRVLYGGSVNSKNAGAFLKARGIDGLLVGGASLRPAEFKKILDSNS